MSNTTFHSTPSKKGTATRPSSNSQDKRADDPQLREDIKVDVNDTKIVAFDDFLRFFFSCCLSGNKQKDFERLQSEIEQLQVDRYNKAGLRHAPRGEGQHEIVDHEPSVEEQTLVEERSKLLDEVLHQNLKHILPIANDCSLLEKLESFATLIDNKTVETDRYSTYADLYNSASKKQAQVQDPSLRPTGSLNLCLSRADPTPLKATFFNSDEKTERKPDFLRTSEGAARETHPGPNADLGAKPTKGFEWFQAPSCEEMKTFNHRLRKPAREVTEAIRNKSQPFKSTELPKEPQIKFTPPDPIAQENAKLESKRSQSGANTKNGSSSKRSRTSATGVQHPVDKSLEESSENPREKDPQRTVDARVQVAGYAMEMLSYGPGVVHVINTLIIDEIIYIWYYDRQGNVSSFGISIIADFPRYLLLLLVFQRFTIEDWGIVPFLNPKTLKHIAGVNDAQIELSQNTTDFTIPPYVSEHLSGRLSIDLGKYLSAQPHCLSGRMTSVFEASICDQALAVKVYSPEVQRISEGNVIRTAKAAAEKYAPKMLRHLPKLYFSGDLRAGGTLRVRSILGISGVGHRTLRLLGLNKLDPITTLKDANAFVSAWVDVVSFHAFLWKHGIEHGDPSLWNAMFDPISKCGVLTDYDLSVMAWLERVPGTDRTGTIPFMALELLTKEYWDGKITRHYYHELEAFIWQLPVVFLAYDDGKLNPEHEIIKGWLTSDYDSCLGHKTKFLHMPKRKVRGAMNSNFSEYATLMLGLRDLVQTQDHMRDDALDQSILQDTDALYIEFSKNMLEAFIVILFQSNISTTKLTSHVPNFDITQCEELFKEMRNIYKGIHCPKKIMSDKALPTVPLLSIVVEYNVSSI